MAALAAVLVLWLLVASRAAGVLGPHADSDCSTTTEFSAQLYSLVRAFCDDNLYSGDCCRAIQWTTMEVLSNADGNRACADDFLSSLLGIAGFTEEALNLCADGGYRVFADGEQRNKEPLYRLLQVDPGVVSVPPPSAGPTRGGTATQPYTREEEEKMAVILQERREKKEADKKALKEEQAAKLKKMEEEMAREKERLIKEEEEQLKEVDEEEEGPPLQRSGQHSGRNSDEMEKKISEWVANLSLGEEEEVAMYIPKDEQEASMKKWEAEEDVLTRRAMEDEQRMAWKLVVMREKKRRVEAANAAMQELEEVRAAVTTQLIPQVDLQRKVEIIAQSVERLAKVQERHFEFSRSQEISVRSMRTGLRDFGRELVGAVGSEVSHRLEKTERFCVGAIEGVKVAAPKEEEVRPRKEPVKVKFPDSYSGKREENFDNWEANVKTYVHLQQVSPDQQVLIAIHALRDEAAGFARSLVRAANCSDDPVAYSSFTSLTESLKLLRERFADVARSVKASDKLQTIHSRKWKSARALKGTMDELVAVPDHGVIEGQLVNLFYRAMPEAFRG
ncbi:hypothetical protein CBR_g74654 [Chara braunii]|uniref:Uncharacterized protein n=1 Tax=Chara braunii TaxID=69332 RepID=A0A388KAC1_CHABU|nr:hypothetical protein CBR_g74654 [Chara braunii]|eukprot:GBG66966.1 hypothetical protein CBR_g74654 [Chara braunii]